MSWKITKEQNIKLIKLNEILKNVISMNELLNHNIVIQNNDIITL